MLNDSPIDYQIPSVTEPQRELGCLYSCFEFDARLICLFCEQAKKDLTNPPSRVYNLRIKAGASPIGYDPIGYNE